MNIKIRTIVKTYLEKNHNKGQSKKTDTYHSHQKSLKKNM